MSEQGNPREQTQQEGGGASDSRVRPLTLSIESQMSTCFLKGHFQTPAQDEPLDNMNRASRQVSAKQRLCLKFSQRVSHQHPTNGNRRFAIVKPDSGIGHDLNLAFDPADPKSTRLNSSHLVIT